MKMMSTPSSPAVLALEKKVSAVRREKTQAIAAQDFEQAARLRDIEDDFEAQRQEEKQKKKNPKRRRLEYWKTGRSMSVQPTQMRRNSKR